jgi:hypothetical protein
MITTTTSSGGVSSSDTGSSEARTVPLYATEALGERGGIASTNSQPWH